MSKTLQPFQRNPLILALYIPSFITSFSQGMLIPVIPLYASSFEVNYGIVGLVLAASGLGQLIGDVPAGMLIRRFNTKAVMVIGLTGFMLSITALFLAQTIQAAILFQLLSGVSAALYNVSRHNYITDAITLTSRGRTIALFGGVHRIGRFVGPAVGGLAAAAFGLRVPFLIHGLVCLVALYFVLRYAVIIDAPSGKASTQRQGLLLATIRSQYRVLAAAGSGQLFAQMIRTGRETIIPLYAADVIDLDVGMIGLAISIAAALEMLMFYPAGMIMDRFGRKYAIVPTFMLQALGMALVPLTTGFLGLLLATSLIGIANGLSSGTMMTLGADLAPPRARGEFLGVWRLVGDAGYASAPVIVGNVADFLALGPAAWTMAFAGLAAAGIFAFLVPETLNRPAPAPVS